MPGDNRSSRNRREPVCTHCGLLLGRTPHHDYMLTDATWGLVHPEGGRGFLHDHCLAERAAAVGVVLDEAAFTDCLCYVNRQIHRATPRLLMEKFLSRHELELARAKKLGRAPLHFAVVTGVMLDRFALQDRAMSQSTCRPSVFHDLFRSDPAVMGSHFPMQVVSSMPSRGSKSGGA